jgi:hypothetical protein
VPGLSAERWYSTPELLACERRVIDYACSAGRVGGGRLNERAADRAIQARPTMADEQRAMVRRLVAGGDAVAVVVGQAGTGKTYALDAARDAWETTVRIVVGAAAARRAALELESGAGIPSTSVAALLEDLRRRPRAVLASAEPDTPLPSAP